MALGHQVQAYVEFSLLSRKARPFEQWLAAFCNRTMREEECHKVSVIRYMAIMCIPSDDEQDDSITFPCGKS